LERHNDILEKNEKKTKRVAATAAGAAVIADNESDLVLAEKNVKASRRYS